MSKPTHEQLKESERHAIALGLQQKQSIRSFGRSPSTVSREIGRNAGSHCHLQPLRDRTNKQHMLLVFIPMQRSKVCCLSHAGPRPGAP